jgi:hypothetical protein
MMLFIYSQQKYNITMRNKNRNGKGFKKIIFINNFF